MFPLKSRPTGVRFHSSVMMTLCALGLFQWIQCFTFLKRQLRRALRTAGTQKKTQHHHTRNTPHARNTRTRVCSTHSGAVREYNGKFMVGQQVLRGSSLATPVNHSRHTYRNFFPAHARWQFSGVRLAKDL